MSSCVDFSSSAKWILSGEHSVVRGGKALAFPLRSYTGSITFKKWNDFFITADKEYSRKIILSLLKMALEFIRIPLEKISGHISLKGNIPMNVGLGSSAAICANIANLFKHCGFCEDTLKLAKYLENKFHQKSSGLDVAVALTGKPIIFSNGKIVEFLEPSFWPPMALTYSGKKSRTSDCANIIKEIFLKNEKLALELDKLMCLASNLCEKALKNSDFHALKDGITLGNEVFSRWGLCDPSIYFHIKKLLAMGAVAAKPIGSGLGGYILSLWENSPKKCGDIHLTLEKS